MVAALKIGRDYGASFKALYPRLAKEFGAGLYPFFLEGLVADPRLMQADRIHSTAEGIDRMAANVAPLVAERLRAEQS